MRLLRAILLLAAALAGFAAQAQVAQPPIAAQVQATTSEPGESTLRQADLRVARVAYRLALAGAPLCREKFPLTGLLFHHLAEYLPPDRKTMIALYRLDRGPGILSVLTGSPAARAGLAAGDVLLAVNGTPFPSGAAIAAERDRKAWRRKAESSELMLDAALAKGPVRLKVLREGRELELMLDSLPACLGRIRLARSDQVNAFAQGKTVVMTTAMLGFVKNDDELAVVLGHELSHDILHHPTVTDDKGLPDEGLLHALGVKPSSMWRREEEADRFGLRLMAAAGFNLDSAIPFWRRYLGKYDWFPQIFRSHPSLPARERIASEEIAAIRSGK